VDPQPVFVAHDGLRIAALDWGGDGPPLLLLHPNGFCAGLFDPLAQLLRGDYRPIGVDLRGHGASDAPATREACSYRAAAGDALAVLDALGLDDVLVLGESAGGAATILLDELRPGIVRRALLCEAIAAGPVPGRPDAVVLPDGAAVESPLATGARRRRAIWPDRETVRESYGSRPPLEVLEPAALAAYIRWGFHDRADGQIELACPPEIEAWYFEGGGAADGGRAAFAHLPSLTAAVTIVAGDATNLPAGMFAAQAEAAGVPLLTVHGSHFFVQEDSRRAAALVREHLVW
jgi:pimeloyl-ACP methyl ester carboxylesterase